MTIAEDGTVWVCNACGKRSRDRYENTEHNGWDSSCFTWAVLVYEDSIVSDDEGRVVKARAT